MNINMKGDYSDFSYLTELKKKKKNTPEIYMKKQYKSSRIENHKKKKNDGVPLKGYVSLLSYF